VEENHLGKSDIRKNSGGTICASQSSGRIILPSDMLIVAHKVVANAMPKGAWRGRWRAPSGMILFIVQK
jgi:hypothetical protein